MDQHSHNNTKHTLAQTVLDHIEAGREHMRPKWHFILKGVLVGTCSFIAALVLLFVASFVIFVLQQNGTLVVSAFGMRGILTFILSLPWFLLFATFVVLLILEGLVRNYAFAYRRPIAYSLLGLVLVVSLGAVAVARTPLHSTMLYETRARHIPVVEEFYHEYVFQRLRNVHRGIFVTSTTGGFIIANPHDERLFIVTTSRTHWPKRANFQVGDVLVIFGDRESSTVSAFGVKRVGGEFLRDCLASTRGCSAGMHR